MYTSLPFALLCITIVFHVQLSTPVHSYVRQVFKSVATECPCAFLVTVARDLSAASFTVDPESGTPPAKSYKDCTISRHRHVRVDLPQDGLLYQSLISPHSHYISLTRTGTFTLTVHGARNSLPTVPLPDPVTIRILERQQNETCPVVIPQQAREYGRAHGPDHPGRGAGLAIALSAPDSRSATGDRAPRRQSLRITGGSVSSVDIAKYLVLFATPLSVTNDSVVLCTGTLIASNSVLTAAHCVYDNMTITLSSRALVGTTGLQPMTGIEMTISSIDYDARYNSSSASQLFYDIAIVTLAQNVTDAVGFMKVNTNSSIPVPRSFVRIAGYGHVGDNNQGPNPDGILHHVDVPVVDTSTCDNLYSANPTTTVVVDGSMQMCAGYMKRSGCGIW